MALLGELGIVQRRIRRFEIGATVLLVGIEEERIQPPVEIVVARDIVSRTAARIELADMPDQIAQPPLQLGPARQYFGLIEQDRQHVGNRALLDDEGAFHVDFAERKLRVQQNPALGIRRSGTGRDRLAGSVAAGKSCPARGRERHRAAANELIQEVTQQTVHRNHQMSDPAEANRTGRHIDAQDTQRVPACLNCIIMAMRTVRASALSTKRIFPNVRVHALRR